MYIFHSMGLPAFIRKIIQEEKPAEPFSDDRTCRNLKNGHLHYR
jgi:DNA-directed RNA polymerase specialized sigma54-like protein